MNPEQDTDQNPTAIMSAIAAIEADISTQQAASNTTAPTQQAVPDTTVPEEPVTTKVDVPTQQTVLDTTVPTQQTVLDTTVPTQQTVQTELVKVDPFASVDLKNIDSIVIKDADFLKKATTIKALVNPINKSTYQTICLQSCYTASMSALKTKDQSMIANTNGTEFERTQRLFNMIHSKIENTSLGTIPFDVFLKITSVADFESLLFGIYAATFPEPESYTITCKECEKKFELKVPANALAVVKDNEVYDRVKDIHGMTFTNPMQILEKSLLADIQMIRLPVSSIVVSVKLPSLDKQLTMLRMLSANTQLKESAVFPILSFITHLLVPDRAAYEATQTLAFIPIDDPKEILTILNDLHIDDIKDFGSKLDEMYRKYEINFAITSAKCPSCGTEHKDISVDIESTLFHHLLS